MTFKPSLASGHDLGRLTRAFVDFVQRLPFWGVAVLCVDDDNVRSLLPSITKSVVETVLVDALSRLAGEKLRDARAVDEWYRARATTLPDFPVDAAAARKPPTRASR